MSVLYPLRFEPCYRQYLWGGRRLETMLGKPLGAGAHFAESWEVVDHGEDQSVVANGPLRGRTLGELRREFPEPLLGRHAPQIQFPLLFKYLDAHQNLSVQVHPDDAAAARLDPPDLGKTEAWVVIHAEPESRIYAGLKRGFDRAAFERELRRGVAHLCLHSWTPQPGDCVFIPAGVVHAIGAGLVVAEIQQSSDTTYRLYDWNRVGADGQPRALHLDQGLDAIHFDAGPVSPQVPQATGEAGRERLVACDKFVLDRVAVNRPVLIGGDHQFHIVSIIAGQAACHLDADQELLRLGQTILIPACCAVTFEAPDSAMLLDMYLG